MNLHLVINVIHLYALQLLDMSFFLKPVQSNNTLSSKLVKDYVSIQYFIILAQSILKNQNFSILKYIVMWTSRIHLYNAGVRSQTWDGAKKIDLRHFPVRIIWRLNNELEGFDTKGIICSSIMKDWGQINSSLNVETKMLLGIFKRRKCKHILWKHWVKPQVNQLN